MGFLLISQYLNMFPDFRTMAIRMGQIFISLPHTSSLFMICQGQPIYFDGIGAFVGGRIAINVLTAKSIKE